MISWLPAAVVLLVAALLAVATATPAIAQSIEPAPPILPAGEGRANTNPGIGLLDEPVEGAGGQVQKQTQQQQQRRRQQQSSIAASLPSKGAIGSTETSSHNEDQYFSEKKKKRPTEELAAIKQIERRAEEAAKAQLLGAGATSTSVPSKSPIYTNQFVIQVQGGELEARKLAIKHGFVYLNHILGDYYHLEHQRLSKRSTSANREALNISIEDEPQVSLQLQQTIFPSRFFNLASRSKMKKLTFLCHVILFL